MLDLDTKDIVLASLIKNINPYKNPLEPIVYSDTQQDKSDEDQSLAPPDLIQQFQSEFQASFNGTLPENFSNNFFSLNPAEKNDMNKQQIFQEHNYCKYQNKG